ncbi:hypothetical protein DFP72DRAFT_904868 [Ephemerocybe angulata]|uniref:DUF4139 domain-containing protein n=1 Tax=Ephemerocybe angulata TaxID=980116 RepID=A0A8H6M5S9_9AGAR|nr:hypothetical protein DFP72DRAFT_904868 [Tulosesus angulatus]
MLNSNSPSAHAPRAPPSYPINEIKLRARTQSRFLSVDLYTLGTALVSRICQVKLASGQNRVTLVGLPSCAMFGSNYATLRPSGADLGVTIQDLLVIDDNSATQVLGTWTSAKLKEIKDRRTELMKQSTRCNEARDALRSGLKPRRSTTTSPVMEEATTSSEGMGRGLVGLVHEYEAAMKVYDDRSLEIQKKIDRIEEERLVEEASLKKETDRRAKLSKSAQVNLFASGETVVELVVSYSIYSASWLPAYDMHISTRPSKEESAARLDYGAIINQNSGEDWTNVHLTLHTAGRIDQDEQGAVRSLEVYEEHIKPPPEANATLVAQGSRAPLTVPPILPASQPTTTAWGGWKCTVPGCLCSNAKGGDCWGTPGWEAPNWNTWYPPQPTAPERLFVPSPSSSCEDLNQCADGLAPIAELAGCNLRDLGSECNAHVLAGGDVNAMFKLAGPLTVPFSTQWNVQRVSIASLDLDAEISLTSSPAADRRVFMNGKIRNTSEYTLAKGDVIVYVDGSYSANANIPYTSPQGTFACSLGADPSLNVVYHPRVIEGTVSGVFKKTRSSTMTQRITIRNTKTSSPARDIQILDSVYTTWDPRIEVKVLSPALDNGPLLRLAKGKKFPHASSASLAPVEVSPGITARWYGADDVPDGRADCLNRDGLVEWVISEVGEGNKAELVLQWELTSPKEMLVHWRAFSRK